MLRFPHLIRLQILEDWYLGILGAYILFASKLADIQLEYSFLSGLLADSLNLDNGCDSESSKLAYPLSSQNRPVFFDRILVYIVSPPAPADVEISALTFFKGHPDAVICYHDLCHLAKTPRQDNRNLFGICVPCVSHQLSHRCDWTLIHLDSQVVQYAP